MTCKEIENLLPAYREDILSPEGRKIITEHLASCPHCSRACTDLKKAEQLLYGLGEVEPPPFFDQKIMSRVREETGQKQGILWRLFRPLHIKIPIHSLAVLLVAVLAIYVYRTGDPEMNQMASLPRPLTELENNHGTAEVPKTFVPPTGVTPLTRAPSEALPKKNEQQFDASPFEKVGKEERKADSLAPLLDERSSAMKPTDPVMKVREKGLLPVGAEALSKAQDRPGKQNAGKEPEIFLPEQKQKEKLNATGAADRGKQKQNIRNLPITSEGCDNYKAIHH